MYQVFIFVYNIIIYHQNVSISTFTKIIVELNTNIKYYVSEITKSECMQKNNYVLGK